jgi:hypothetical protein
MYTLLQESNKEENDVGGKMGMLSLIISGII